MKKQAKNNILKIALLPSLLASASTVVAQEAAFYGRVDAGYSWAKDADFTNQPVAGTLGPQIGGSLQSIGKSAIFGFGAGYRINNQFRTDITYNYRGGFKLNANDSVYPDVNFKSDITANTLMLNSYWTPNFALGSINPYLGLGLGYSRNKVEALNYDSVLNSISGTAPGGSSNNFAWQLMAGGDIALNKNVTLDIAYHYVDLGEIKTNSGVNSGVDGGASFSAVYDGIAGNLRAHELHAGLRYEF